MSLASIAGIMTAYTMREFYRTQNEIIRFNSRFAGMIAAYQLHTAYYTLKSIEELLKPLDIYT